MVSVSFGGAGFPLELETHLIIAQKLNYLKEERLQDLRTETRQIGKMLNGLIRALRMRYSRSAARPLTPDPRPRLNNKC